MNQALRIFLGERFIIAPHAVAKQSRKTYFQNEVSQPPENPARLLLMIVPFIADNWVG